MNKGDIAIGCDPELFAKRGSRFVSVHEILPGTKTNPCTVPKGAVQVDGVAAEFNILPAKNSADFVNNIKTVRGVMEKILNSKTQGLVLVAEPTATFSQKYFDSLPFSVKALGCEPDYSAYTRKANPKPETTKPFRTGSGHVHIQTIPDHEFVNDLHSDKHFGDCVDLVKELDVTLYEASKFWDTDTQRMELYGKPGSFRPKPYGLEYRVLSNAWLRSEQTMRYVFEAAKETTAVFLNREFSLSSVFAGWVENKVDYTVSEFSDFLSRLGLPAPLDYISE